MHNHSYENEFLNLHVNEISHSHERTSTKTRFEKEAEGNSEMAYYHCFDSLHLLFGNFVLFFSCDLILSFFL